MHYRVLGKTGIKVSTICLGTASFGLAPLAEDAANLVARAADMGVNFINTATHYGNRRRWERPGAPAWDERQSAEEILGDAIKGRRHDLVITTKVGVDVREGPNGGGNQGGGLSRRMIRERVELSLRRLQTDYVDFLYAQNVDRTTPLEVTLGAFDDLVRQGKVLHYGLSNFPAWKMVEAIGICQQNGFQQILGQEIAYNMVQRDPERDIIPASQHFGLATTTWYSLAGGLLTGEKTILSKPQSQMGMNRWGRADGPAFTEAQLEWARQLDTLADRWGHAPAHLALGWLLSRPTVESVIMGPETIAELEENAPGGEMDLSAEQLQELDKIGQSPVLGWGS